MRILYSHRVQSRDGPAVHIEELLTAFRAAGHQVRVVGPSMYERAEFGGESNLIAALRRRLPTSLLELAEIAYNISPFLRLRRAWLSFRPDFVYERYNMYFVGGFLLKRLYGVPLYLEVNAPLAEERATYGGLRFHQLARQLERFIWQSADRIFVVTRVLGDIVVSAGIPRERVTVTPNGVNRNSFPAEPYRPQPEKPITLGFVGFVRDWHGLDAVISGLAAYRDMPRTRLLIVGEGTVCDDLRRQAEKLGVSELVEFGGVQGHEAIPQLIRSFDIALQPKAVRYASPLKLFEYMACGRAIVAPDQPNIREILRDGETALLFDPDDQRAMWESIHRLIVDPGLRERLGRAARDDLDANDYSWEGNAARIIAAANVDLARRGHAITPVTA